MMLLFASSILPMLATMSDAAEPIPPPLNLAPNPSFEGQDQGLIGWYPVGIVQEGVQPISLIVDDAHTGEHSLRVKVGPAGRVRGIEHYSSFNAGEATREAEGEGGIRGVRTIAYRLDRDIHAFKASAWIKGADPSDVQFQIRWYARRGRRRPVELLHIHAVWQTPTTEDGWVLFSTNAVRPQDAHQAQLWIETGGDTPLLVDDVTVLLERTKDVQILVDQLGYPSESRTKQALLQSSVTDAGISPEFEVIDLDSLEVVLKGEWEPLGYHAPFDRHYWRGDFNALARPGNYVIQSKRGRDVLSSTPFTVSGELMAEATRLAYEFFYYQRCGMEIPGFHKACHLDDAQMPDGTHRDLVGGWHDAGDYNKYNAGYTPESVYALALAYRRKRSFFDAFDRDCDGVCDILDEARWGADYLLKCLDQETYQSIANVSTGYRYWGKPEDETNGTPDADDRPVTNGWLRPGFIVGALAILGEYVDSHYLEIAERIYQHNGGSIRDLVALCQATSDEDHQAQLERRIDELLSRDDGGLSEFRELAEYVIAFPGTVHAQQVRSLAATKYRELKSQCDDYFRVRQYRAANGQPYYFRAYREINDWYVGDSSEILDLAYMAMLAVHLDVPEARQIAEDQLHWLFGRNPFDTSLMESIGRKWVPSYHHRYNMIPGNPRGAVPGAVLNGITRAWPWTDRPWLDLNPTPTGEYQPNEPWLPHNLRMLYVLSLW